MPEIVRFRGKGRIMLCVEAERQLSFWVRGGPLKGGLCPKPRGQYTQKKLNPYLIHFNEMALRGKNFFQDIYLKFYLNIVIGVRVWCNEDIRLTLKLFLCIFILSFIPPKQRRICLYDERLDTPRSKMVCANGC